MNKVGQIYGLLCVFQVLDELLSDAGKKERLTKKADSNMDGVDDKNKEWFESWFDSKLYDLMYEHRDQVEAETFLHNLLAFLRPQADDRFLDLACGTGRHAKVISEEGYHVIGIDLSSRKLKAAASFTNEKLEFYLQDMRKPFRRNYFNYVLNLFTSFGYFENVRDNEKVLRSVRSGLVSGGTFVLDYLNTSNVLDELVVHEVKNFSEWQVQIEKKVHDGRLTKYMTWTKDSIVKAYTEEVSLFYLSDFERMFANQGLMIHHLFGDYELNPYNEAESPRLILIATAQ